MSVEQRADRSCTGGSSSWTGSAEAAIGVAWLEEEVIDTAFEGLVEGVSLVESTMLPSKKRKLGVLGTVEEGSYVVAPVRTILTICSGITFRAILFQSQTTRIIRT